MLTTRDVTGQVLVSVSAPADCYGGRRLHLRIEGLPGWVLGLVAAGGPFELEASSYRSNKEDGTGPDSVLLGSTRVVEMVERQKPC